MESLRVFLVLILGIIGMMGSASATPITSFENDFDGWTIAQGTLPEWATVVTSFTSTDVTVGHDVTISPSHGLKELRMVAGETPIDSAQTQFASVLTRDAAIHIGAGEFLLMDVNLAGLQSRGKIDWLGVSINGTSYSVLDTEMMHDHSVSGWKTFGVHFLSTGSFDFGLLCVNGTSAVSSSRCAFDHIRTADALPSVAELAQYPLVGGTSGVLSITLAPPVSPVPEPETWALMLLGITILILIRRMRMQSIAFTPGRNFT